MTKKYKNLKTKYPDLEFLCLRCANIHTSPVCPKCFPSKPKTPQAKITKPKFIYDVVVRQHDAQDSFEFELNKDFKNDVENLWKIFLDNISEAEKVVAKGEYLNQVPYIEVIKSDGWDITEWLDIDDDDLGKRRLKWLEPVRELLLSIDDRIQKLHDYENAQDQS